MADSLDHSTLPHKQVDPSIAKLVALLPEVYQPIFGHPKLSIHARRACEDRLDQITHIYQTFATKLNRPLRVLDLGCAQGFFSFSLAEKGATVCGIDFQSPNITLCKALAKEHPAFNITFQEALIENIITDLEQGTYDLVLGLSVFHHLVYKTGILPVQKLLAALAKTTTAGIFEMALAHEPPYWASAQPENPRHLLNGYIFVHQISENATHLSTIPRPLYVASNHYWFLNNQIGAFDSWKMESHPLANGASYGTRRYLFGDGLLVKLFRLDFKETREANLKEHANEITFLANPPETLEMPYLLLYGQHEHETWLVREQLPGDLLLNHILGKKPYNTKLILEDILEQLVVLESKNLYHNDLRTWNILIGSDGHARLIDYGAISTHAKDSRWPYNIFLSFMIFVRELLTHHTAAENPIRQPSFNPEGFPDPYRHMWWKMFELDINKWSFALLHKYFLQSQNDQDSLPTSPPPNYASILQIMDEACIIHQNAANYWHNRATRSEDHAEEIQNMLNKMGDQ